MGMYGAPGTPEYEANRKRYEQYILDLQKTEEQKRAENAAGLRPSETNLGQSRTEGMFYDTYTPINAYYLDPSVAGTMTDIERVNYYDYLRNAANQGQNIYGQQQSLASALAERAAGRGGPSIAELQLAQTLEQNKRDAAGALAAAGRSINPALAQRILMQQRSQLQGQAAGQGAVLRAQEQQAAQTALANQLSQMRGAESTMFGQAASAGYNQTQLAANLEEAQKQRNYELARANQEAAKAAAGQAQTQGQFEAKQGQETLKNVGTGLVELGKGVADKKAQGGFVRKYADGGKVSKAKVIAAHAAAKKNMGAFKEQYGKKEGKDIAYATMMKLAKENKLAEGGDVLAAGKKKKVTKEVCLPNDNCFDDDKAFERFKESGQYPKSEWDRYYKQLDEMNKQAEKDQAIRDKLEDKALKKGTEGKFYKEWDRYEKQKNEAEVPLQWDEFKKKSDEEKSIPALEKAKRKMLDEKKKLEGKGTVNAANGGMINAAMGRLESMDNEKNDTIPAMLSPGEIVIPRSVVNAPNAPVAAAKFVEALLANKDKKDAKKLALKAALTMK